jgi:hypothetical protein
MHTKSALRNCTTLLLHLALATALLAGGSGAAQAAPAPPVPAQLLLTVRETTGVARTGEVVRSGVPIPRELNLLSTQQWAVVDAGNALVPAEFQVLARWNAGRADTTAPIQWALVTFPAGVAARGSTTYRLVTDGSAGANPPPPVPVSLVQAGNQITVTTGAATFVLGGSSSALFDEIRLAGGTRLSGGSTLDVSVGAVSYGHTTTRRVYVEHAGPLAAIVVVEGVYDMPAFGGGSLSAQRRYVFTAGSPTAIVRHAVRWEGDLCDDNGYDLTCDPDGNGIPDVNGVRVTRLRDAFALDVPAPRTVTAIGDFDAPALQGEVQAGQAAWVRQQLRAARTAPLAFDVSVPGTGGASGAQADGGVLAAGGTAGTLVIALNHLHRYEPQALRLLADGRLAVDLADDQVWLGQRQGLFATLAVSALPPNPTRAQLDRQVWAPLNHPLRAWPQPVWFAASQAVDEFPDGVLPGTLTAYDTLVSGVLTATLQQIDAKGLSGLMTFGLYPRYWGNPVYGDELDCGPGEPTPNEAWDNTYWCATWTDYHGTLATVPTWAMRTGAVEWLDELAFPGALRMLYTQIEQCAPGDTRFYCGQAPAGYGGYREDFNSSHAYFDNLFLYYWLTGDDTVVETLQRGASTMRDYLCARRPAEPCLPDDPPVDVWAQLTGRVASQWLAAFRFVGLAGDDPSYLDDWRSGLARAVTQYYVEATQNGTRYGFWLDEPVGAAGRYSTTQLWMASLYDMNNLYRLQVETRDAPIGNPLVRPSRVQAAWARTLARFGATVSGDGTAGGLWPNALYFTWSGARVGGALALVEENTGGGDPYLYTTGKSTLTAVLVRASDQTGEYPLQRMGTDMTALALGAALDDLGPLGKIQGEYLARLHAAVARLARPVFRVTVYLPVTLRGP